MSEENTTFIRCSGCGKSVSHVFSWPDDTPFIVRAWVECPECVEKEAPAKKPHTIGDALVYTGQATREEVDAIPPGMSLDEFRASCDKTAEGEAK